MDPYERPGGNLAERHSYMLSSVRQTTKCHYLGGLRDTKWQRHAHAHFRTHLLLLLLRALEEVVETCNQCRNRVVSYFHDFTVIELQKDQTPIPPDGYNHVFTRRDYR